MDMWNECKPQVAYYYLQYGYNKISLYFLTVQRDLHLVSVMMHQGTCTKQSILTCIMCWEYFQYIEDLWMNFAPLSLQTPQIKQLAGKISQV